MLDTLEEKLTSLREVAAVIAGSDSAQTIWFQDGDHLRVLRVVAGDKTWAISGNIADPAHEDQCVDYLLRKMAYAAHRCPACLEPVARLSPDAKTNKTPVRSYRCGSCMHSWQDS